MPASNWGLSPDTARLLLWLPHTLIFLLYKNLVCLSFILLWNKRKCCNILKSRSMAEQVSHQSFLVHRSFEMRWFACGDLQDTRKPGKSDTVLSRALGRAYWTWSSCAHQPLPQAQPKKELLVVSCILCLLPQSWATPVQSTQQKARLSQAVGIKPATEEKSSALTMFEKMDFTPSQRQGKKHVSIRQKNCFDISCSSLMELEQEAV